MPDKDIVWMDWARCAGIYLVIFAHVLQITSLELEGVRALWNIIYIFHMPLFFMISGYLWKIPVKNEGRKLLNTLVVPYLLYQFVFFLLNLLKGIKDHSDMIGVFFKSLAGMLMGDGYSTKYSMCLCLPCWFLVSIIQLRLLFSRIRINRWNTVFLCLFSIVFLYLRQYFSFDLYFCIDSTIMAVPYFLFGFYLKRYYEKGSGTRPTSLWLVPFLVLILVGIYWVNGASQMNGPSYGKDPILNYIGGIAGSLIVFVVSMKVRIRNTIVKEISRNTLFIIFFHWLVLYFGKLFRIFAVWRFIDQPVYSVFAVALFSLFLLLCSWWMIRYLEVRCPVLLGKQKYKN